MTHFCRGEPEYRNSSKGGQYTTAGTKASNPLVLISYSQSTRALHFRRRVSFRTYNIAAERIRRALSDNVRQMTLTTNSYRL
jgi:hypothetical protein